MRLAMMCLTKPTDDKPLTALIAIVMSFASFVPAHLTGAPGKASCYQRMPHGLPRRELIPVSLLDPLVVSPVAGRPPRASAAAVAIVFAVCLAPSWQLVSFPVIRASTQATVSALLGFSSPNFNGERPWAAALRAGLFHTREYSTYYDPAPPPDGEA
jgi:hypothetical protein